jgi:hypothetical protein
LARILRHLIDQLAELLKALRRHQSGPRACLLADARGGGRNGREQMVAHFTLGSLEGGNPAGSDASIAAMISLSSMYALSLHRWRLPILSQTKL